MNPGAFKDTTAAFLIFLLVLITVANVSCDVCSPLTTSSNRIMFAGLKK